jgi:putative heme-binding domain-containing protein
MRQWLIIACGVASTSVPAYGQSEPRIEAVWAAGPLEARVGFNRAIDRGIIPSIVGKRIVFGDDVKIGDRALEVTKESRPGGAEPATRGSLSVSAARLDDGGRTLVLATDPHSRDATYALNLPAPMGKSIAYSLRGVDATWYDAKDDARPDWKGWSEALEYSDATSRLRGWVGVHALPLKLRSSGRLTYRTLAALPKGKSTVRVRANVPFELELGNDSAKSRPDPRGGQRAEVATDSDGDAIDLTLTIKTDGKTPIAFKASYSGPNPGEDRDFTPAMLTVPWAPAKPTTLPPSPVPPEFLSGGDPAKGALVFKGDQAKCANCHKVRGEGKEVGPDLSDLIQRDREWTFRQISEPSAVIHPDYVPYTVLTKDGRVLVGIVRAVGADAIRVIDTEAKETTIAKSEIEELRPSATSIMPVGLLGTVGEAAVRDLIAYLTTAPPARP